MNGREIEPGIWHWEEDYRVYCTLVQGERLAILWDTGRKQDLSAWVAAQVSTPCIVCNSHGHSDHIGGIFASLGLCPSGGLAAAGCPGQIDREIGRLVPWSRGAV
ncbi:MAG: MBL fold metallo-hydrolase [Evtepia gabavorous]